VLATIAASKAVGKITKKNSPKERVFVNSALGFAHWESTAATENSVFCC